MSEKPTDSWREDTISIKRIGARKEKRYDDGHWTSQEEFHVLVESCGGPSEPLPQDGE
ncbi:hypothetical protein AB0I49_16770 [Streptomyces sp. NPDC050617]|uniref:hypothetical protein n=1 Tax=Streptomyces sp. NPDC050617 TaxID=3154628 RepID=UPI003436906F